MATLTDHTCNYAWCVEKHDPDEHIADPATLKVLGGQIEARAWIIDGHRRPEEVVLFVEQFLGGRTLDAELNLTVDQARQLQAMLGTAIENLEGTR